MKKVDFQELYLKYHRFSADAAYRIIKDEAASEDICQEVFFCLYRIRHRLDPSNEEKIRALIFHVTVNKCRDYCRKNWRIREIRLGGKEDEMLDEHSNPEVMFLEAEEKKNHLTVLEKLRNRNPQNFDILVKVKIWGFSPDELAAEYGISRNNINNRIYRARIWMEKELKKLRR